MLGRAKGHSRRPDLPFCAAVALRAAEELLSVGAGIKCAVERQPVAFFGADGCIGLAAFRPLGKEAVARGGCGSWDGGDTRCEADECHGNGSELHGEVFGRVVKESSWSGLARLRMVRLAGRKKG